MSEDLYHHTLDRLNAVCLLKNFIRDWQPMQWSLAVLSQYLSGQMASVKVGTPYKGNCVPKESDCSIEHWDLGKLCTFLQSYQSDEQFYYAGYAHILTFNPISRKLLEFDWSWAGLSSDSSKSTIWVGSKGSFTPCHKDSYGCNLHAQISGFKEWLLWPPDCKLGASRMPYEESSTFTNVDVLQSPWIDMAIRILVQPGEVLFIPKHWWHLARNQEASISVNTWIELECDAVDRLKESITRLVVCSIKSIEPDRTWVNPGEELTTHAENVSYIRQSLSLMRKEMPAGRKCSTSNYYTIRTNSIGHLEFETFTVPQHDSMSPSVSVADSSTTPGSIVDSVVNAIVADDRVLDRIVHNLVENT